MAFSALIRTLERSQLAAELLSKLQQQQMLHLSGLPRLPKGLVASALAQGSGQHLLVVTATIEEAGRWAAQLEAMGWQTVHFYPTTESSPYGATSRESETIWGQMPGLAELVRLGDGERGRFASSGGLYDFGFAAAFTCAGGVCGAMFDVAGGG